MFVVLAKKIPLKSFLLNLNDRSIKDVMNDSIVLSRGLKYQREGQVVSVDWDQKYPNTITAYVEGSEQYEVDIYAEDTNIKAACTCQYIETHGQPCKHIAAVLFDIKQKSMADEWFNAAKKPTTITEKPQQSKVEIKESFFGLRDETDILTLITAAAWGDEFDYNSLHSLLTRSSEFLPSLNISEHRVKTAIKTLSSLQFFVKGFYYGRSILKKAQIHEVLIKAATRYPEVLIAIERACAKKQAISSRTVYYDYQFEHKKNNARLRVVLYLNQADSFEQILKENNSTYLTADAKSVFSIVLDTPWLKTREDIFVNQIFDHNLNQWIGTCKFDKEEDLPFLKNWLIQPENHIKQGNNAVMLAVMTGSISDLDILSSSNDGSTAVTAALWGRILEGRHDEIGVFADQAIKIAHKGHGNRKSMPPHMITFGYQLAHLIARTNIDLLKESKSTVDDQKPISYLQNLFDQTMRVWLTGDKKSALQNLRATIFLNEPLLNTFFREVFAYWISPEEVSSKQLNLIAPLAASKGLDWITAQIFQIKKSVGKADTAVSEITTPETIGKPVTEWLGVVNDWELSLDALLRAATGAAQAGNTNEQSTRLIWLVDFENETLIPKEQTYSKNAWSGGRTVAFKRLKSGDIRSMSQQDKDIAIEAVSLNYYDQGILDMDKAVPFLVGHPLLFLAKSPTISVQLVEEKPKLIVQADSNGSFSVRLNCKVIEGKNYVIQKESPTRYKFIQLSKELLRVQKALGDRQIEVPESGREKLVETIQVLVGTGIEVQTGLPELAENLPSVEPDSRIRVHILPGGNGFYVELYTKPLGETPPYCTPGEGDEVVFGIKPKGPDLQETTKVQSTRNLMAETANLSHFLSQVNTLQNIESDQDNVWMLDSQELALQLMTELEPMVQAGEIAVEWPKGQKIRIARTLGMDSLRVQVNSGRDWFALEGTVNIDEGNVMKMSEFLMLIEQSKSDFIELSAGKFIALSGALRKQLEAMSSFLYKDKKTGEMRFHPLAAGIVDDFANGLSDFEADKKWHSHLKHIRSLEGREYALPAGINADLRDYQLEGFKWLCRIADWGTGACLADDMGLGKTLQVLAVLVRRASDGPALVVAPASVVRNWVKEAEKFTPSLNMLLFGDGENSRESTIRNAKAGDVVVATYNLLQREATLFSEKEFTTVVLDEAQAIKNANTKRSETAMNLQAGLRIITTGTPLENHLGELWNLFQFINPGLLGSKDLFADRFAIPIERDKDESRREALRKLIRPFVLRRLKRDVLKELPAKTEITLTVELSAEETVFYESIRRNALAKLTSQDDAGGGTQHLRILAEIMRLRQACCNPRMVDANIDLPSSKLALFETVVDELRENGHRALVFSQFVEHLKIIREALEKKGIPYQYLDGSTPIKKRQVSIDAFQEGEGDLFLISLRAGGSGINLTAADYVIHMDPWWNPAVEDQATDRAHRIGQNKPVTVYRLITANTIEEKIVRLHEHKRDLADSLLSGTDVSARLGTEELMALLRER